jgi:hypothetical protein
MQNIFYDVTNWWNFLGAISLINIGLWLGSLALFVKKKKRIDSDIYVWRRLILVLSGFYVAGCAFRSFLPRIDLERVCLVNSWLSNMLVGRSVATVAELCFVAQCAILLREAGVGMGDRPSILVSYLLIPMIVIAELFSWYAMLTTRYIGSVVEESLWTLCGILLIASFISLWPKVRRQHRWFMNVMILFGIGFVFFMTTVDVPMYWERWQADSAAGVIYLTISQGILDAIRQCHVSFDIKKWYEEIPWMTLYFSVAVWVSISLTHAPNYKQISNSR